MVGNLQSNHKNALWKCICEGETEKEITDSIKRLQSLEKKVQQIIGFSFSIPSDVVDKLPNFEYTERVLVLLNYSPKPLTRQNCKDKNEILRIPASWWIGSNFSRDLKKKAKENLIQIIPKEKPEYKITTKGKKRVKQLLSEK